MIDKQTFEQIFRHHYDGMFRLARRMLGDDAESKDVVSDVFASLLDRDETKLKSETLQGFLLTSVRNRCVNLLVHKQKEQAAIVNLKDNADEDGGQERLNALRDYIDTRLPELSQHILRLRFPARAEIP